MIPRIVSDRSALTPDTAIRFRDSLHTMLVRYPEVVAQKATWGVVGTEERNQFWVRNLAALLPQTELILWKPDLWNAAIRNAQEAFENITLPPEWFQGGAQLWKWDGDYSGEIEAYHLDVPCSLQALVVVPVAGATSLPKIGNMIPADTLTGRRGFVFIAVFMPTPERPPQSVDDVAPRLRVFPALYSGDGISSIYASYMAAASFLRQEIVALQPERMSRPLRREYQKVNMPEPVIRTVLLRRRAVNHRKTDTESDAVEWNYRWLVRGHWRQQWYPSAGERRPIYIAPHVKGPENKELKAPDTIIFSVAR